MPIVGLSHPRAVTRVPDPIHGVIELNVFDRDIVDSRAFQRLHFVLQQSVSYTSFPANKNTRFPHSLGTAHTVGRMFAAAMSNAEPTTLKAFLNDAADFLLKLIPYLAGSNNGVRRGTTAEESLNRAISGHGSTISGASGFRHSPLPAKSDIGLESNEWRVDSSNLFGTQEKKLSAGFIVDTIWQSLRLYALTHDIGHLPMSHAFENAITRVPLALKGIFPDSSSGQIFKDLNDKARKEFSGLENEGMEDKFFKLLHEMIRADRVLITKMIVNKPLHEVRSFAILNGLLSAGPQISDGFPTLSGADRATLDDYESIVHNLALCIVYSPLVAESASHQDDVNPASFLYAVRQLVDGAVDGDRLDYTLRDCHAAGTRFGDFDLERIVRNSILLKKRAGHQSTKNLFAIGFGPHAIAGIEQFFEARYQSYKYLVHHRTASRSNIAVEALVEHLFAFAAEFENSDCAKLMEQFGYIKREKDQIVKVLPIVTEAIEQIDDCSLRMLLHQIRNKFVDPQNRAYLQSHPARVDLADRILSLSEVVLFRDFRHIVTLFRHQTFDDVLVEELGLQGDEVTTFSAHIEADLIEFFAGLRSAILRYDECGLPTPVTLMYEIAKPKVFEFTEEKNLSFEKTVWIRDPRGQELPLGDRRISVSLSSMAEQRATDKKLRLYAAGMNLRSNTDTIKKLERMIIDSLRTWHENFKKKPQEA